MSTETALFLEIYGCETFKATVQPKAVTLPWEDPSWSYNPLSKASAAVCAKIENDAFVREALGELPEPVTPEPLAVETIFAAPQASNALVILTKTLTKTWESKKHSQAISTMLSGLKSALKFKNTPDRDAAWDRIVTTCTNYVCSAIHQEAGDETI